MSNLIIEKYPFKFCEHEIHTYAFFIIRISALESIFPLLVITRAIIADKMLKPSKVMLKNVNWTGVRSVFGKIYILIFNLYFKFL